jgi:hypothetical protein
MIDKIVGIFGCAHRRLTRPITPVNQAGAPSGETYVVCLDCGKQFAYDWDHMRIGKALERSNDAGVLHPEMPSSAKSKIKYALLGSAVPLAILVGNGLLSKRRGKTPSVNSAIEGSPELQKSVDLPHGGPGAQFLVGDLIHYLEESGRGYIIIGEVDCAFADHPRPRSLDYWLREHFARNKESKQATAAVVSQLLATGLFEEADSLRCPDTGQKSAGLRLKSA